MANLELGCVFDEKALKLDGDFAAFKPILDDALAALGKKVEEARASIKSEKVAAVVGIPTLAEKGVTIGITIGL
jgi:hypothetical protein